MSEIEWGPEIETGYKMPEWVNDDMQFQIQAQSQYGDWLPVEINAKPSDWNWSYIPKIRVKAHCAHYDLLHNILNEAYDQAASGKGKERHANGKPWDEQPIAEIGRMVGVGFNTGQAIKKLQESSRMEPDAACHELLGAIVYAASAIMLIRERARHG